MQTEIIEAQGMKFKVRPNTSDQVVLEDNLLRRSYQKHGVEVKPGQAWMDIGGYIGTFAANVANQGARVVSFEPDPENAELFKENIRLNGFDVSLIEKAVLHSPTVKQLPLYKNNYRDNWAANTLFQHWKRERPFIVVDCIGFEEAFAIVQESLQSGGVSVKLDCEGAEIEILEKLPYLPIEQLTFEYHFAVEPACERFWDIIHHLEEIDFKITIGSKIPLTGNWPNPRMQTCQVYGVRK